VVFQLLAVSSTGIGSAGSRTWSNRRSSCTASVVLPDPATPRITSRRRPTDGSFLDYPPGEPRTGQDYVERHGDARVPQPYTVDGYPLGVWVGAQRQFHRKGTLEADRERRLQGLTGWTWDARGDKWEQGFSRLQDYIERHRHASVPVAYTVDGYRLGQWVLTQRHFHANGTLDADREHRLHDLPGWKWDPFADQWEEGFRWLVEYVERHGDARVPHSYTVDGFKLGYWVLGQRQKYARGTLSADRKHRLHNLPGWTWKARSSTETSGPAARSSSTMTRRQRPATR
jgi:hypothetical protein